MLYLRKYLLRMNIIQRLFSKTEERGVANNVWNVFTDWMNMSSSGKNVNEDDAKNLSAVYGANKILSEDVASLPVKPYYRDGKDTLIDTEHFSYNLLNNPNTFMSRFTFFETAQTYLNLWGNFYARIVRDGNNVPKELIPIHPSKVSSVVKNQLWYKVEGFSNLINARDMIHVLAFLDPDEYKGLSPIIQAKEVMGNGLALQEFSNKFFGNGANMSGILSTENKLDADSIVRIRDSWKQYEGSQKSNRTAILEQGLKYTKLSVEPEAAQFLQSRKFAVTEIARWFRIPPHMLADLEHATFSNIEHQSIQYVRQTLVPWLVRYEQEFNRKLFTQEEQKTRFIKFNVEGLLRGDSVARTEYYSKLFNMASISQNEIRALENMNPIPEGDKYYISLNMVDSEKLNTEVK